MAATESYEAYSLTDMMVSDLKSAKEDLQQATARRVELEAEVLRLRKLITLMDEGKRRKSISSDEAEQDNSFSVSHRESGDESNSESQSKEVSSKHYRKRKKTGSMAKVYEAALRIAALARRQFSVSELITKHHDAPALTIFRELKEQPQDIAELLAHQSLRGWLSLSMKFMTRAQLVVYLLKHPHLVPGLSAKLSKYPSTRVASMCEMALNKVHVFVNVPSAYKLWIPLDEQQSVFERHWDVLQDGTEQIGLYLLAWLDYNEGRALSVAIAKAISQRMKVPTEKEKDDSSSVESNESDSNESYEGEHV